MQPTETPPPADSSYEFILKTEAPPQKPLIARLDTKKLLILITIFAGALIALAMVMSTLNAKAAAEQVNRLVGIAQMQTEIVRIAGIGVDQSVDSDTQTRAQAIHDGINDSLDSTKKLLLARGSEPSEEELAKSQSTTSDDTLKKAATYGSFDKAFEKLIDQQMLEYQRALLAANKAGNADEQKVLNAAYEDTNSILGLVDQK